MRLLIHFARYGPYHHARLRAAHEVLLPLGWEVIGLETAGTDATYAWDEAKADAAGPRVVTAFPGRVYEEITAAEYRQALLPLLDSLQPDAMAIAGWGTTDAAMCLSWCRKHDKQRIVMSETRAADGRRVWWKELLKRYLISRFHGALVGGKSHRGYLVQLGMRPGRVAFGYNVVDNDYFRAESGKRKAEIGDAEARKLGEKAGIAAQGPENGSSQLSAFRCQLSPYFLASNRFIERKNLLRLIEAYAAYGRATTAGRALVPPEGEMRSDWLIHEPHAPLATSGPAQRSSPTWPLVLLGDGEQKPALIARCKELGLAVIESAPWEASLTPDSCPLTPGSPPSQLAPMATSGPAQRSSPSVYFPGFRQIDELPRFYAHAGCFIHPALEEPWGLVLNEAMACGLPILSSNNVGAAEELVDDGVNGWKFDPENIAEIARLMAQVSASDFPHSAFAAASRRILEERCPTRAFGEGLAKLLG